MTSGRILVGFFFINKCKLYIIVAKKHKKGGKKKKKRRGPLLVVLIPSVYERKGRKKAEKINVTFSLSGWAVPFQRRGPRLWEVLALSPSHGPRWLPGKTFPEFLLFLLLSPDLLPGSARCRFTALLSNCRGQG